MSEYNIDATNGALTITLSKVGPQGNTGSQGIQGETGPQGESITGPQGIQGVTGEAGLSIQTATINSEFELILTFTDSTTLNCGSVSQFDLGAFSITESSGDLFFSKSGTNLMKLDGSGNLAVVGDVNSNATL
jgi:hypothetical protein